MVVRRRKQAERAAFGQHWAFCRMRCIAKGLLRRFGCARGTARRSRRKRRVSNVRRSFVAPAWDQPEGQFAHRLLREIHREQLHLGIFAWG